MAKKGVREVDVQLILSYVRRGFKIHVGHDKYSQIKWVFFKNPDGEGSGVQFDRDTYTRYALQKILDTATVAGARNFEVAEQERGG